MCAIYKKELRAYLTSMTGYIFMAVLLAVTSLYYVANCLVGGYPVFGAILSSVYFVLLIIVPVLTMRSMAEEKRQKTDQLLMTAPVSLWKIVLGKYLAMVTVFLIPMAILCLLHPIWRSLSGHWTVSVSSDGEPGHCGGTDLRRSVLPEHGIRYCQRYRSQWPSGVHS